MTTQPPQEDKRLTEFDQRCVGGAGDALVKVGAIQLTLCSPLFEGHEGRPRRPVVPLFEMGEFDTQGDPLEEFSTEVGHDTFSALHRRQTSTGITLKGVLKGKVQPTPIHVPLLISRDQALEAIASRRIEYAGRVWQLDIGAAEMHNLIEGFATTASASSADEAIFFTLLTLPEGDSGITFIPLADEIIVPEDDLIAFLDERVVPGARGLPCLLKLPNGAVRELVDFGSTQIDLPDKKSLSVVVAKSPQSLLRPGSVSIQHIWVAGSPEAAKLKKLKRQIATIAESSRNAPLPSSWADPQEPQLALRSRWRIDLFVRGESCESHTANVSDLNHHDTIIRWSLPESNLQALAIDLGATPTDSSSTSLSALAPPLLISHGDSVKLDSIRRLITEALSSFLDRDPKVSSEDGRLSCRLSAAEVSLVKGSAEVRVLMRNPAAPRSIDFAFVLQHQNAIERELVQSGFEKGIVALRKASRLKASLSSTSAETTSDVDPLKYGGLDEEELMEAHRLLSHIEANKGNYAGRLFKSASMLERMTLIEAALNKSLGGVPPNTVLSRIDVLQHGAICVAIDPHRIWGCQRLIDQVSALLEADSNWKVSPQC